ncbi:hypothetical protein B566_EDAN016486, partial [Ephemera danica]
MDETGEEYLVSTIKIEEEQLECSGQESTENENLAGFVAGSSTVSMAEPDSTPSLFDMMENLESTFEEAKAAILEEVKKETDLLKESYRSSRSHLQSSSDDAATKPGRFMSEPEFRDFVVDSLQTLAELTKKSSESVNAASQVSPDHEDKA